MAKQWYYFIDGKTGGPFDDNEFSELVQNGTVHKDTFVRTGTRDIWRKASEIEGVPGFNTGEAKEEKKKESSSRQKRFSFDEVNLDTSRKDTSSSPVTPEPEAPSSSPAQPETPPVQTETPPVQTETPSVNQPPAVSTSEQKHQPPPPPPQPAAPKGQVEQKTRIRTGGDLKMKADFVLCPHCWERFSKEDILFIASHSSLVDDHVLGYGVQQRFLPSRFTPEGQAIDSMNMVCPDMACPRCHLSISQNIIDLSSLFFSIAGAPASGKTYYLTSMIWELRNRLSRVFNFSFTDADPLSNAIVSQHELKLFLNAVPEKVTMLSKTQMIGDFYDQVYLKDMWISLPKPFIYKLQPTGAHHLRGKKYTRNVVIYDNAGEHFEPGREEISTPATRHLIHSNGLIFLFDPVLDAKMRRKCNSPDPQLKDVSKVINQETLLTEMISRIRHYGNMKAYKKYPYPLIVAVGKYDIWKELLEIDLTDDDPWLLDEEDLVHGLDYNKIANVSYHVRNVLLEYCPSIVSTAESFSSRVYFVPVSSLGCPSEEMDDADVEQGNYGYGVRPERIKPIWVGTPILLLLAAHNYVPIIKTEVHEEEDLVIEKYKIIKDTITFTIPGTHAREELPSVYFGTRLYSKEQGKWFILPEESNLLLEDHEKNDDGFWKKKNED